MDHPQHQTYDSSASSAEMRQAYQYNHHQPYDHYTCHQFYYQQQQPPPPRYPYYTQHDYTYAYDYSIINNNNQHQRQQQEEDPTIYPPGVPPPQPTTSTHGSAIGPVSIRDGTQHYHHGALGIVKGPINPSSRASFSHSMARDMQQHLPKHQYGIPQVTPQIVQPSHASFPGSVRHAVRSKGPPTEVRLPRPMAWCELCRVDCNSHDILEQHKNGKKHKKNLKAREELQKLLVGGQRNLASASRSKPENLIHLEKVEGSGCNTVQQEDWPLHAVNEVKEAEIEQQKVQEAEIGEEPGRYMKNNNFEYRGRGSKRKMKGGRGGKWIKSLNGTRKPVEPPKPKEMVPFICEMCDVKCETPVVFQSHLCGKKHLTNLKRFQGQQTLIGPAALEALYPALHALYPAFQQLQQQGTLNLQNLFALSGPSGVLQGQTSEAAPAPLSAFPGSSTSSQEQKDIAKAADQSSAMIEGNSPEPSVSANPAQSMVTDSNVGHLDSKVAAELEE